MGINRADFGRIQLCAGELALSAPDGADLSHCLLVFGHANRRALRNSRHPPGHRVSGIPPAWGAAVSAASNALLVEFLERVPIISELGRGDALFGARCRLRAICD